MAIIFRSLLNNLRTGAKFQVLFHLATCSNYSITDYVKIPVFHFFYKGNKGQLLTKKNDQILLYYRYNKIIKGPGISFQSPALSQNSI